MGHSAQAPANQGRQRRGCWIAVAGAILAGILVCALGVSLLLPYAQYERTHDIPNPIWGLVTKSYAYTPETAATLNPVLLKTRPDLMVLRDIHDYIQLAGTYPCATDLSNYTPVSDPILMRQTRTCPYKRPVVAIVVTRVYVGIIGPDVGRPGAIVTYTVSYADGTRWTFQDVLGAEQYQQYYFSFLRLTCWDSFVITSLYSYLLPLSRVPSGMAYSVRTPTSIDYRCQP